MKLSSISIIVFLALHALSSVLVVNSQGSDSCNSNLNLNLPFDTSSLHCLPVWSRNDFILRFAETSTNVWSFVLSAPDTNSYVAVGFSSNGQMVGSSAVVGWIAADGTGTVKEYFLGGQRPNLVVPDQGSLTIVNGSSITSRSSRVYMAFQLNSSQPSSRVLYSVGQTRAIPSSPGFALTEHRDKVSTSLNYVTGTSASKSSPHSKLRKSHGILNMLSWGILMIIGAIIGRYFKQWDPIWFYSHAVIQSCAFLLGTSGIISGFVLEDRLSVDVDTHKALGILILVLGCLQVMAVFARPGKGSKLRKYWNWYHHNGGRILIIFAIANVFYGIHLGEEGRGWNAGYGVVIAILFLVSLILEFNLWREK